MILVITPSTAVQESIPALLEAIGDSVHVAPTLHHAATLLRTNEYSVIVLDQFVVDCEPIESEMLLQHIGTAIPLYANFGVTGLDRFVRELKAALLRRDRELTAAKAAAEQSFRKEWSGKVTAMLLSCEMAMQLAELPVGAETRLKDVYDLACELRVRLSGMVEQGRR